MLVLAAATAELAAVAGPLVAAAVAPSAAATAELAAVAGPLVLVAAAARLST